MSERKNSLEIVRLLSKKYTLALSILAVMLLLSQGVIQFTLHAQQSDSRVVNLAGRQRMLSQRMSKSVFGLYLSSDQVDQERYLAELDLSLDLWTKSHEGLKHGDAELGLPGSNSPQIIQMFKGIEPNYAAIVEAVRSIRQIASVPGYDHEKLLPPIQEIKDNEPVFLSGMDAIVFQYDSESKHKVSLISLLEYVILIFSFLVLALEVFFIFKPAQKQVRLAVEDVENSNDLLARETLLFEATVDSIGEGIIVTDASGKITLMNPLAETFTGWTGEEATSQDFDQVFAMTSIKTGEKQQDPVRQVLDNGIRFEIPANAGLVSRDGTEINVMGNASAILSEHGGISGVVVSFRDITREYVQEKEIEGFLNINLDMLCVADTKGNFHRVNHKFEEILGFKTADIEGKNFMAFVHEDDIQDTLAALAQLEKGISLAGFTNRYRCKDGTYKYIEWYSQPGIGNFVYNSARDVTEKRLLEEQLKKLAIRDDLTGLFNRYYFERIIEDKMGRSDQYDEPLSMLLFDLDHFKLVNDTWGHPVGDEILKMAARAAEKTKRDSDVLIRFGGEEFIMLMPQTSLEGAVIAADKIREAIERNNHLIAGRQTASFGVCQRSRFESYRHWYKRVDHALYRAKLNGRNCVVASDELDCLPVSALYLDWSAEWDCGSEDINQQHREEFDFANQMLDKFAIGTDPKETLLLLESFLVHVSQHYDREEKVMVASGYPNYASHEERHRELVTKALRLMNLYKNGEIQLPAFLSYIVDEMILRHIAEYDTKYFHYMQV